MRTSPAAIFLACCVTALAQEANYPVHEVAVQFDSGFLANADAVERVVWTQDVTVDGADWLQLRFADTHLPAGSRLRIAAPEQADWAQWHDARSIADYRYWSCQFTGPTLRVELVAAPHTTANRTRIDLAVAMDVGDLVAADTICGTTDDRVLGSDPRVCRIGAGCTAWLFSQYAVGTAGHCMDTTAGRILHFNVPLSSATGTAQPSHPDDQYAMEAFHPFLNGGVGQDWSVSVALRNSNTQLYPGEAQGSWFTVVPAPAFVSGQQIRITGHGSGNGISGSPTWNLVQKTLVGPRQTTATATALRYGTDTTGGNSGSPVILEGTGQVIGVHTHGGCTTTGGGNSGTDAIRADWTAARAQVHTLHTIGSIGTFGTGCGGSSGTPLLSLTGIPEIGRPMTMRVENLMIPMSFGWTIVGASDATWIGSPLPADLAPIGGQGCSLLVSNDFSDEVPGFLTVATRVYTIPSDPWLVGRHLYWQYFGLDATAPNALGLVGSQGIDLMLGN